MGGSVSNNKRSKKEGVARAAFYVDGWSTVARRYSWSTRMHLRFGDRRRATDPCVALVTLTCEKQKSKYICSDWYVLDVLDAAGHRIFHMEFGNHATKTTEAARRYATSLLSLVVMGPTRHNKRVPIE